MMIVVTGTNRCDFTYYLGRVLYEVSPRVVIIDNSYSGKLFNSVLGPNSEDVGLAFNVKRSDITYLKDVAYSPEFFEAFDFVVIYEGETPDFEEIDKADYALAMPNYEPENIEKVKDMPENTEYIMRDHAGKIADKALFALLDTSKDRIIGSIEYSDADYAKYLGLIYNGKQKPAGVSEGMRDALVYTVAKLTDGNEKMAAKYFKKASKL